MAEIQIKLSYGVVSQLSVYLWRGEELIIGRKPEGEYLGAKNVLFFDLVDTYAGTFTLCKLIVLYTYDLSTFLYMCNISKFLKYIGGKTTATTTYYSFSFIYVFQPPE